MHITLAGIARESIVDGPGLRYTVFTQGCPHHCPGCHNPGTHDFRGGTVYDTEKLIADINEQKLISGVTFSGGEPFCQAEALCEVWKGVSNNRDLIVYSGYTFEHLLAEKDPARMELLSYAKYLIDGPFILAQRDLTLPFRGSKNQRIVDVQASLAAGEVITVEL